MKKKYLSVVLAVAILLCPLHPPMGWASIRPVLDGSHHLPPGEYSAQLAGIITDRSVTIAQNTLKDFEGITAVRINPANGKANFHVKPDAQVDLPALEWAFRNASAKAHPAAHISLVQIQPLTY